MPMSRSLLTLLLLMPLSFVSAQIDTFPVDTFVIEPVVMDTLVIEPVVVDSVPIVPQLSPVKKFMKKRSKLDSGFL